MPIQRYVDGTAYRAWLIGCDGPGVQKDIADLTTCLESTLSPGYRATVERPMAASARTVTAAQIEGAFAAMERFDGHRIIWFGGHADVRDGGVFFRTQGRASDHIPLSALYERLDMLARTGNAPLWAIMDFCHAAPEARPSSEKLILFCAAHGAETARGTDTEGGLFTQSILAGLSQAEPNEAGQITVDALRTWVNARVSSGRQHPYFAQGYYGTRALNSVRVPAIPASRMGDEGAPLTPSVQTLIVEALVGAKLVAPAKRSLLFNGLPDALQWSIDTATDPISQLRNDVKFLAEATALDGQTGSPLARYLENAVEMARAHPKYQEALSQYRVQAQRSPSPPQPVSVSVVPSESNPPPTRRALRKALSACYEDVESARTLCRDAGLELSRITFMGTIENIWQSALDEAEKSGRLDALVALAHEDYPARF